MCRRLSGRVNMQRIQSAGKEGKRGEKRLTLSSFLLQLALRSAEKSWAKNLFGIARSEGRGTKVWVDKREGEEWRR